MSSLSRTRSGVASDVLEEPLRLHQNENPYGCSLLVQESLSIHDGFARVPGPVSSRLLRSLGEYAGRSPDHLYLANTPEELLSRLLAILMESGDELIAYSPHGGSLLDAADAARVSVVEAPWGEGAFAAGPALRLRQPTANTVVLCSPNEITGRVAPPLEVVSLLKAGMTVVVDERYAEFTDKGLGILASEFPNLVSLRTFGPWAGLWGVPVSYALASAEIVDQLKARWSQSLLTAASRVAAGASLDDATLLMNRVRHIRLERARLFRRLRKLNFLQPLPSHGPFLCCQVTRGEAERVCGLLEAEGILIHNCVADGLPGHVRISVGTPEQTDHLFATLTRISVSL